MSVLVCTYEVGQSSLALVPRWLWSWIWNEILSLHVKLISVTLMPSLNHNREPEPRAISKSVKQGEQVCNGCSRECMDGGCIGGRAILENPSILSFKVSGCKCVHGACIEFNKWLGYHVYPNVHVYKHFPFTTWRQNRKNWISLQYILFFKYRIWTQ